jgi:hypothetical protein
MKRKFKLENVALAGLEFIIGRIKIRVGGLILAQVTVGNCG